MSSMTPDRADHLARVFVCGLVDEVAQGERTGRRVINTGHWSGHFADHPWVVAAEAEGWSRELRGAVILAVKRRMMLHQAHHDIDQLMPPKPVVEFWRGKAASEHDAAAWQEQNFAKHSSRKDEARPLGAATRDVFRQMQRGSRNNFHLTPLNELSLVAKRMGGGS